MFDWFDAVYDLFFNESADGSGGWMGDLWEGAGEAWNWFGSSGGSSSDSSDTTDKPKDKDKGDDHHWYDFLSDGDFWGSAITSVPALISGLNSADKDAIDEELARERLAIEREKLAADERMHKQSIDAQLAGVDAAREAATKRSLAAANQMLSQATNEITKMQMDAIKGNPELIEQANARRIQAAQATGTLGTQAAHNAAGTVAAAALSRT